MKTCWKDPWHNMKKKALFYYATFQKYGIKIFIREIIFSLKLGLSRILDKKNQNPEHTTEWDVNYSFFLNQKKIQQTHLPSVPCIDIIICVHNALTDIKKCISSVITNSSLPYSVILIDDGSDEPTKSYLETICLDHGFRLIRNENAKGYTYAANQGLKYSVSSYIILLNSDTVVPKQWLEGMVQCANFDEKTGIIGPLSNTASWQSVPDIYVDGDWAHNPIPPGYSFEEWAKRITENSARIYPVMSFLNGFCLLIKRDLIDQIGFFDEQTFGAGFGEENDYCIRTLQAGWKLRISDDVFIYHSQSKSYSNNRRLKLAERADRLLVEKYGKFSIENAVKKSQANLILKGIRERIKIIPLRDQYINQGIDHFSGKKLLVLLPVREPAGGSYVVLQECMSMKKMGVEVAIFNLEENKGIFEENFADYPFEFLFGSSSDIPALAIIYDGILCTSHNTVPWIDGCLGKYPGKPIGYYIQDYEPLFYPKDSKEYLSAKKTYTQFPFVQKMTKTRWNRDVVNKNAGICPNIIGISVDIDYFRPLNANFYNQEQICRPLEILALIRPQTPRRNPKITVDVLSILKQKFGNSVQVHTFGCLLSEFMPLLEGKKNELIHHGLISRFDLLNLLNKADIFLDLSSFQAMGLTALEAMSCGTVVFATKNGGISEIIQSGDNGYLIDITTAEEISSFISQKISTEGSTFHQIKEKAIATSCLYFPEKAAFNILKILFDDLSDDE